MIQQMKNSDITIDESRIKQSANSLLQDIGIRNGCTQETLNNFKKLIKNMPLDDLLKYSFVEDSRIRINVDKLYYYLIIECLKINKRNIFSIPTKIIMKKSLEILFLAADNNRTSFKKGDVYEVFAKFKYDEIFYCWNNENALISLAKKKWKKICNQKEKDKPNADGVWRAKTRETRMVSQRTQKKEWGSAYKPVVIKRK